MENSKKKIGSIVLTVYLTLVTIGCALFGYLYFASKKGTSGMSITRAQQLVNMVCYDLGLTQENPRDTTSSNEVSATSLEDFTTIVDDEEVENMRLWAALNESLGLFCTKELLASGYEQNSYCVSKTDKEKPWFENGMMFASQIYATYRIEKDTIICDHLQILDVEDVRDGNNVEYVKVDPEVIGLNHAEISYTSDSTWEMEFYSMECPTDWDKAESIKTRKSTYVDYVYACSDDKGITTVKSINFSTNESFFKKQITNAKAAELYLYYQLTDVKTKKQTCIQFDARDIEDYDATTISDVIKEANILSDKVANLKTATFKNMNEKSSTSLLDNVTKNIREFLITSGIMDRDK